MSGSVTPVIGIAPMTPPMLMTRLDADHAHDADADERAVEIGAAQRDDDAAPDEEADTSAER